MLKFDKVSFSYGKGEASLTEISFQLHKGDFAAVIGSNGAGKSTLSKLCNGLIKPASGTVTVDGMTTASTKSSQLARTIGYLFQNPDQQICQNTVREEILFTLSFMPGTKEEKEMRCQEVLDDFSLDGEKDPFHMSRGERQIVALASILAGRPKLLILDEPTTGLDYRECMLIMEYVKKLNEAGTTVLMITHDMEIVQDFAKRVLVLSDGKLLGDDACQNIMVQKELLQRANVMPAQIPALALQLGEDFEGVYTVQEMVDRIGEIKAGKVNKKGIGKAETKKPEIKEIGIEEIEVEKIGGCA